MKEKLLKQIEWKKRDDEEREMMCCTGRPKIRYFTASFQLVRYFESDR